MGAGESCMAAEIDFDSGVEPAQVEAVSLPKQEACFGKVISTCYTLHPFLRLLALVRYRQRLDCLQKGIFVDAST